MRRRPPRVILRLIEFPEVRDKNWTKHRVSTEEVHAVFKAGPVYWYQEKGLRRGEDMYAAVAPTPAGRLLVVFFVHKLDGSGLILSARDASRSEKHRYETTKRHRLQC